MRYFVRSSARDRIKLSAFRDAIRKSWRWLFGVLGLVLAWYALQGADWGEVLTLLAGLSPLAVLVILVINLLMLPLMTARWWLLLRTLGSPVSLLSASFYRSAANAVSYLTPGPHFGGEPLSVYLLHRRHGMAVPAALTSVIVDRLLELLASIVILTLALSYLVLSDVDQFVGNQGVAIAIAVMLTFICILVALFTGRLPLSRCVILFKRLSDRYFSAVPHENGSLTETIRQGENIAESLFRDHPYSFMTAHLLSLAHWLGIFAEFWLMSFCLGYPLSFLQLIAVVVFARLAFFTPLPAGIGVLESALPFVTAAFGLGSTLGISLCLIIRIRDILFSLAGLGLAMKYLTCRRKLSIITDNSGE